MKKFSLFVIPILTLFCIGLIEVMSWTAITLKGWQAPTLFIDGKLIRSIDPCRRFIFDLQLGQIHDASGGCKIKGGYIDGAYVRYDVEDNPQIKNIEIVTLGGSTTDGYFQEYANGDSWPYLLQILCNKDPEFDCEVMNGGVGGFSSSRELRKLMRDVATVGRSPDFIISLNGINELDGYDGAQELTYPYYNEAQLAALEFEKFIITDRSFSIFPNTKLMFRKVLALIEGKKGLKPNKPKDPLKLSNPKYLASLQQSSFGNKADLWTSNQKISFAIAEAINAEYLVFLQPTAGLFELRNSNSLPLGEQKMAERLQGKNYTDRLRALYFNLSAQCKQLQHCVDISGILKPLGLSAYHDWRHPNAAGNQIIALRIFEEIKSRHLKSK